MERTSQRQVSNDDLILETQHWQQKLQITNEGQKKWYYQC